MNSQWSPHLVIAWALWITGAFVIGLDLFVPSADDIGHVGLALGIAGKVFHDRALARGAQERERTAYELGKKAAAMRAVR